MLDRSRIATCNLLVTGTYINPVDDNPFCGLFIQRVLLIQ